MVAVLFASLLTAAPALAAKASGSVPAGVSGEVPGPPLAEAVEAEPAADVPGEPGSFVMPPAADALVVLGGVGEAKAVEGVPVTVAAGTKEAEGRELRVEVLDVSAAERLGSAGFVFRVSATDGDVVDSTAVVLRVDYSAIRDRAGASFASRLALVAVRDCVLLTAEEGAATDEKCDPTRVRIESTNDLASGALTVALKGLSPEAVGLRFRHRRTRRTSRPQSKTTRRCPARQPNLAPICPSRKMTHGRSGTPPPRCRSRSR